MTATPMSDDHTALLVTARVLEAIRPYCLLELTTRYTVSHDGHRLGAFTIDEALDVAEGALKQVQQKWDPVLRPDLRAGNGPEHPGEPRFAGDAPAGETRR